MKCVNTPHTEAILRTQLQSSAGRRGVGGGFVLYRSVYVYMYSLLVSHYLAMKPATILKFYCVIAERKIAGKHI